MSQPIAPTFPLAGNPDDAPPAAVEPAPVEPVAPVPTPPAPKPTAPVADDDDDDDDPEDHDTTPHNVAQARKLRKQAADRRIALKAEKEAHAATTARAEAAEARADAAELDALCSKYGISDPVDIALIGAGTAEEKDARAARIGALVTGQAAPAAVPPGTTPPPSIRPVENLRPGATPPAPVVDTSSYPESWKPRAPKTQN